MLWAAYPAESRSLTDRPLAVVSIYGTLDGLATVEKIHASRPLLPSDTRWGPLVRGDTLLESAWHDPRRITPAGRAGYRKPLKAENWDHALWELTKSSREPDLVGRMGSITLPSLVISGDDDRVIPVELGVRLAEELPNAGLVVISDCGHVPHKQCPEPFLDAVEAFLGDLR